MLASPQTARAGPLHGAHTPQSRRWGGFVVCLLVEVIGTQGRATDATHAVLYEALGTRFTDQARTLGRGRRDAYIGHFAGNTGTDLRHWWSPSLGSRVLACITASPWSSRGRPVGIARAESIAHRSGCMEQP